MKTFREYINEQNINEGFFTRLKNKLKFAASDIGEYKHYYNYDKNNALTGRVSILDYDKSEDTITFETEDIITGKKTKTDSTITQWYKDDADEKRTAGWLEYSDDEQGRAFKFIQSVYQKDTSIVLKAKTKYILNDTQKITGEDTAFNIAKSKFNKNIDLVDYQGRTTDGDKIAFDPTEIKGK
jgi:hypothetical protein